MVLPVIATIIGTILGVIVTVWVTKSNRQFEQEQTYRQELISHIDDLFKPLFQMIGDLWATIGIVDSWLLTGGKEIGELGSEIQNARQAFSELKDFTSEKYDEMSLYLPSPFPWIFAPLDELLVKIFQELEYGHYPKDDITKAVNAMMSMQTDLKKLLGYSTTVKLDTKYPFE